MEPNLKNYYVRSPEFLRNYEILKDKEGKLKIITTGSLGTVYIIKTLQWPIKQLALKIIQVLNPNAEELNDLFREILNLTKLKNKSNVVEFEDVDFFEKVESP